MTCSRVPKKNPSGLGQRDVRAGAIEELNAEILLKRLDLETHGGLREVQLFGGLAEAELLRNCPEDHKAEVFETRHSTIRTLSTSCGMSARENPGQRIALMSA